MSQKAELDADAHTLLTQAKSLVEAVVMGVAQESPHREFAVSWLRRWDDLNRRYYENAARNGWSVSGQGES